MDPMIKATLFLLEEFGYKSPDPRVNAEAGELHCSILESYGESSQGTGQTLTLVDDVDKGDSAYSEAESYYGEPIDREPITGTKPNLDIVDDAVLNGNVAPKDAVLSDSQEEAS